MSGIRRITNALSRGYGTYEAAPGAGIRHLEGAFDEDAARRYLSEPRGNRRGDDGQDVIYNALGARQQPTRDMQGVYDGPEGVEYNPGRAAIVDDPTPEMMDRGEALGSVLTGQNAGAWHIVGDGPDTLYRTPRDRMASKEQLIRANRAAGGHFVADTGDGLTAMSAPWLPPLTEDGVRGIGQAAGKGFGAVPGQSNYLDFSDVWHDPNKVVTRLEGYFGTPEGQAAAAKIDNSPEVRRMVQDRMLRDAEIAQQTGKPVRQGLQQARAIFVRDGLTGLFRAARQGTIPAAAVVLMLEDKDDR